MAEISNDIIGVLPVGGYSGKDLVATIAGWEGLAKSAVTITFKRYLPIGSITVGRYHDRIYAKNPPPENDFASHVRVNRRMKLTEDFQSLMYEHQYLMFMTMLVDLPHPQKVMDYALVLFPEIGSKGHRLHFHGIILYRKDSKNIEYSLGAIEKLYNKYYGRSEIQTIRSDSWYEYCVKDTLKSNVFSPFVYNRLQCKMNLLITIPYKSITQCASSILLDSAAGGRVGKDLERGDTGIADPGAPDTRVDPGPRAFGECSCFYLDLS